MTIKHEICRDAFSAEEKLPKYSVDIQSKLILFLAAAAAATKTHFKVTQRQFTHSFSKVRHHPGSSFYLLSSNCIAQICSHISHMNYNCAYKSQEDLNGYLC